MSTWAIILTAWLALQLPLAMLIGKSIKFGMREPVQQRRRSPQKRSASVRRRQSFGERRAMAR
jgi:hypothetical protein